MKCPICGSEMVRLGIIESSPMMDDGLPEGTKYGFHYWECEECRSNEKKPYAHQRAIVDGKWYYFNNSQWNYLKEAEFNPSRRDEAKE